MTYHEVTRAMGYTLALIILGAVMLILFASMGTLEAPATMPVPPSETNYSSN